MKKSIGVVLVAASIVALWLARPAAQVPSLGPTVTILRDKWGVPHVFQNDPALSAQENDDFGVGDQFRTFNVVPPGNSGLIDIPTLVQSQTAADARQAVNEGNPHVFDQVELYEGWRYKHFVQHQCDLESPTAESIPYLRGVIPQPDPTVLRGIWRMLDQAGITLPNFTLLSEVSTE